MVKQVAYGPRRHAVLLDQIEDNPRIQVAAPAAHREAVKRGEAHGRGHALAPVYRAHAGSAAEMGDNDATLGRGRSQNVRKNAGNIFIGQAVESIAPDPLIRNRARQRVSGGDLGLGVMEGGIEARDLRQCRVKLRDRGDRRKIVRLMQRRQWNETLQFPRSPWGRRVQAKYRAIRHAPRGVRQRPCG